MSTAVEALGVLSTLKPYIAEDIDESTIEPFAEGAWFAWRNRDDAGMRTIDITNGVWWTERRALSLAMGTGLHSYGGVDWETYAFVGAADGKAEAVCCHVDREAAERCALTFLIHGCYCTEAEA